MKLHKTYGGEADVLVSRVDGTQCLCTPDGMQFFVTTEQLFEYIAQRCGKDVSNCFTVVDPPADVKDEVDEAVELILDTYLCEF